MNRLCPAIYTETSDSSIHSSSFNVLLLCITYVSIHSCWCRRLSLSVARRLFAGMCSLLFVRQYNERRESPGVNGRAPRWKPHKLPLITAGSKSRQTSIRPTARREGADTLGWLREATNTGVDRLRESCVLTAHPCACVHI